MATLTNTKIKDTYVGLLKTTDNQAIDASGVTLVEDGAGNASALSVGRSGNGVTITGNVGLGTTPSFAGGSGLEIERAGIATLRLQDTSNVANAELQSGEYGLHIRVGGNGSTGDLFNVSSSGSSRLLIDNSGNVGIGTSSPSHKVEILGGNASTLLLNNDGSQYTQLLFENNGSSNSGADFLLDHTNSLFKHRSLRGGQAITFETAVTSGTTIERMRIDGTGNVGIGTSTATSDVHLQRNVNGDVDLRIQNANAGSSATATLNVDASGNNFAIINYPDADTSNANRTDFKSTAGGSYFTFSTTATERMRIDSSGNVLIGTTGEPDGTTYFGSAFTSETSGRMLLRLATTTSGAINLAQFYNSNGVVGKIQVSGTATSYITSSDYRLKENVVEMTGALDRVDALKPSRFNFIADPETTVDGFLAHEVAEVVPEAISGEKDAVDEEGNPIYQGIDQSKLTPLLTAALKEAHALIKSLEARIEILENK